MKFSKRGSQKICWKMYIQTVKSTVYWVVMQCSSEKALHFGGNLGLHLHVRTNRRRLQAGRLLLLISDLAYSSVMKMEEIYS
jgi:hypothetical protein